MVFAQNAYIGLPAWCITSAYLVNVRMNSKTTLVFREGEPEPQASTGTLRPSSLTITSDR